jgi:hypothetical protein
MKHIEQTAKSVSTPKTGFFALLGAPFCLQGSSASAHTQGTGMPSRHRVRLRALLLALLCALTGAFAVIATSARAYSLKPGVEGFSVTTSSDQAGAHANLTTSFAFQQDAAGGVGALLRNAEVVYPLGITGYPAAVKTCNPVQLEFEECPSDSQIGVLEFALRFEPGIDIAYLVPVYNMAPPPNEVAVFGFVVHKLVSGNIVLSVGPEYRVHAQLTNLITGLELGRAGGSEPQCGASVRRGRSI